MLSSKCRARWGHGMTRKIRGVCVTFKFLAKLLYCSMSSGLTDLRARPRASCARRDHGSWGSKQDEEEEV